MLLTSLEWLLGYRADRSTIRTGYDEASVDGVFAVTEQDAQALVGLDGVVEDHQVIVSRTVSTSRSRAAVSRRPAPVSMLSEIGPHLAVIHGQAEQLTLRSRARQRDLLDEYGGATHAALVNNYREAWNRAVDAKRALDQFREAMAHAQDEIDRLTPVLTAIDDLDPHEGEDDELRIEAERLTHAEHIRSEVHTAHALLAGYGDDGGAAAALAQACTALRSVEQFDPAIERLAEQLASLATDADSIREDLTHTLTGLDADPGRLDAIQTRRKALTDLMRGRALDINALLRWADDARRRLDELHHSDATLEELDAALVEAQQSVLDAGEKLSEARVALAQQLSAAIDEELHALAMAHAHLLIRVTRRDKPGSDGVDDIEMLLQPHPDLAPAPIARGASGGELSRVMLAIEVAMASRSHADAQGSTSMCPNGEASTGGATLIFDEVDAGVGGAAAREVGARLGKLARHRQVIVVTHLPQVAAWGDHHLVIEKDGATTSVREVSEDERVDELARMLSGTPDSSVARAHAAELLEDVKVAQLAP